MKKNLIKISSLGLLSILLIGCNSESKMKEINTERAAQICSEITKRYNQESFVIPNNFSVICNKKAEEETKTFDSGYGKVSVSEIENYYFDIDNLIMKHYFKSNPGFSSGSIIDESEDYVYFDQSASVLYYLNNNNGYKTKYKSSDIKTKDAAINVFKQLRKDMLEDSKNKNPFVFHPVIINFNENYEEEKVKMDLLANENDQYYKLYFGSNDEKSFQKIVDTKLKLKNYTLEGYETTNTNYIFKNDLLESMIDKRSASVKDEEGQYSNGSLNNSITCKYGNIRIDIPNLSEYKDVEEMA